MGYVMINGDVSLHLRTLKQNSAHRILGEPLPFKSLLLAADSFLVVFFFNFFFFQE